MMLDHRWDEKLFAEMTEFLGMNIILTPVADIVEYAASFVLKPLEFARGLRRAVSDNPRLSSYYDLNLFEESFVCAA